MKRFFTLIFSFPFFFVAVYVAIVHTLGIGVGIHLVRSGQTVTQTSERMIWDTGMLLLAFAVATGIVLAVLRYARSSAFLKALLYLAIIDGAWISLSALYPPEHALGIVAVLVAVFFVAHELWVYDILLAFALAGIAALLGSMLAPYSALAAIAILALYDYIAVNKTGHMVTLFKQLTDRKVHFALIIPATLTGLRTKLYDVSVDREFMFLGTGDIAIPLMFSISLLHQSLGAAAASSIGGWLGCMYLCVRFAMRTERRPIAGLPPILAGAVGGWLVWLLLAR